MFDITRGYCPAILVILGIFWWIFFTYTDRHGRWAALTGTIIPFFSWENVSTIRVDHGTNTQPGYD